MKRSVLILCVLLIAGMILSAALEITSRIYLATQGVSSLPQLYQIYDKVYPTLLQQCPSYRNKAESENESHSLKTTFHPGGAFPTTAGRFPHPYLGFTEKPTRYDADAALTNYSFSQQERSPDIFRVGLFGGSVANMFSNYAISSGNLAAELKKRIPQLAQKKIEVLNFATSGYRQPQQYIAASLYADSLDMTINLDGYNELASESGEGYPLIFPHYSRFFVEKDLLLQFRLRLYRGLASLRDAMSEKPLFNSCGLLNSGFYFLAQNSFDLLISQKIRKFHTESKHTRPTHPIYPDESHASDKQRINVWTNFTLKQHRLLSAQKIRAYFFIQPNQYVKASKPLHPLELEMFNKNDNPGKFAIFTAKYKLLEDATEPLKKQGVKVYSLVSVFKNISEPIYIDDCCHINESGNQLILEEIVHKIHSTF